MSETSPSSSLQNMLRSVLYNIAAAAFLIITGYVILTDANWSATGRGAVSFAVSALCALLGNLDRIETLKASIHGVEAKTRAIVVEAESTIMALRRIAAAQTEAFIDMMEASGRFGGPATGEERHNQKAALLKLLASIGVPETTLAEVAGADRKWVLIDYLNAISEAIIAHLPTEDANTVAAQLNPFIQSVFKGGRNSPAPISATELTKFAVERLGTIPPILTRLIAAYGGYVTTGKHPDLELWLARFGWHEQIRVAAAQHASARAASASSS